MGRRVFPLLLLSLFIISGSLHAAYPQREVRFPVTVDIPGLLVLELDPDELVFSEEDILRGEHPDGDTTILIASKISSDVDKTLTIRTIGNMSYVLMIGTEQKYLTSSEGAIPFTRLEWRHSLGDGEIDDESPWNPVDWTNDIELTRGYAGEEILTYLDFRVIVHVTDPIGDYQGELIFTLSANGEKSEQRW